MSNMQNTERKIAFFISPHGFGHAARACAVMEAVSEIDPSFRFEIFTSVPRWFFRESLPGPFGYHLLVTDVGMVQQGPLREDVSETVRRLDGFLPFDRADIADLAEFVKSLSCELVICDIAPMGIGVAEKAGIPSVLIENFTWDWIYSKYTERGMEKHVDYLADICRSAGLRIQTEPVCSRLDSLPLLPPIRRKLKKTAETVRRELNMAEDEKMVLVTMGGVGAVYSSLHRAAEFPNVRFVVPGGLGRVNPEGIPGNLTLLPDKSDFFHPDLANASDAVIGKAGYSTIAEVWHAGVPFGYFSRPSFPESDILSEYIGKNMPGFSMDASSFNDGSWMSRVPELLSMRGIQREDTDSAGRVARIVLEMTATVSSNL